MAVGSGRDVVERGGFWKQAGKLDELRELWCDHPELSAADIGRRMGVTKNAVISAVHRWGIPARLEPVAKPKRAATPFESLGADGCRYPIGHPDQDGFHFCGEKSVPGKSYCDDHRKVTVQKVATRGEAMAILPPPL